MSESIFPPNYFARKPLMMGTGLLIGFSLMRASAEIGEKVSEISLSNRQIEAIVAPEIGRIVAFSQRGDSNFLWINPKVGQDGRNWPNYGGDRVLFSADWLWSQIRGHRIPDSMAVAAPWKVLEQTKDSVMLESRLQEDLGVRMQRRITLTENGVDQHYCLERVKRNAFPVQIWTIAQVPLEGSVWMGIREDSLHRAQAKPYLDFGRNLEQNVQFFSDGRVLRFQWSQDTNTKVGVYGDWLAWARGSEAFLIVSPWRREPVYLDQSNLQVFAAPGRGGFIELETQSPTQWLAPNETLEHRVRWQHLNLPVGLSEAETASFLRKAADAVIREIENQP